MRTIILFHYFFAILIIGYSQEIAPKHLRGAYTSSAGEAGRTYKKFDGSQVSLPPVTYSKTTLKIKRGKKATIETVAYHSLAISGKQKVTWEIINDTLVLTVGERVEKYLMKEHDGRVLYLTNGRGGYTRRD
jgi:hypothetical protein